MNKTLQTLYDADQEDRKNLPRFGTKEWDDWWNLIQSRDIKRQEKAERILKSGKRLEAIDYYNTAMIFQHSKNKQKRAVSLARKSIDRKAHV